MVAIIVRENNKFSFMDTDNFKSDISALGLRSRLNSRDIKYYKLDLSKDNIRDIPPYHFVEVLNKYPHLADNSNVVIEI